MVRPHLSFIHCSISDCWNPIDTGEMVACSGGANFTPHVITVPSGEVVVGSFLPSYKMQQKIKRPRLETGSASTPTSAIQRSNATMEEALASGQDQQISATVNPNPLTASPFSGENWSASLQPAPGATNTTDINTSLPGG
ncbi:hypothetical protein BHE74_00023378 [Ensete ventricosum]|nr:hypothetical protein BHE74_00023378 [Ensete ventricosum]